MNDTRNIPACRCFHWLCAFRPAPGTGSAGPSAGRALECYLSKESSCRPGWRSGIRDIALVGQFVEHFRQRSAGFECTSVTGNFTITPMGTGFGPDQSERNTERRQALQALVSSNGEYRVDERRLLQKRVPCDWESRSALLTATHFGGLESSGTNQWVVKEMAFLSNPKSGANLMTTSAFEDF